jgi:hypothetical protein
MYILGFIVVHIFLQRFAKGGRGIDYPKNVYN